MASNDVIVLQQILEEKRNTLAPDLTESEFFEFFTAEQVLKDHNLNSEELFSGIVDGGNDGGIDSIYTFVNGDLQLEDSESTTATKGLVLDLVIIQSKSTPSFSEDVFNRLIPTVRDLLDLSKSPESLGYTYNKSLITQVSIFRKTNEALVSRYPKLHIKIYCASKGAVVSSGVSAKAEQLKAAVEELFSSSVCDVIILGASELLQLARVTAKTTYELRLIESPITSSTEIAFVGLASLSEYQAFISDESGRLNKEIFEANVRDYQRSTSVNEEIQTTLKEGRDEADFWWLNNGVTVLCTNASYQGKTLTIEDPQIVNGLQTSEEIFKYFKESNTEGDERNLLVRVIVPGDGSIRDHIIKATNSQTIIPLASLRATDPIHRNIEDYLLPRGLFYDRRKNQYRNAGKPLAKIISITSLAQSVISVYLRRPDTARARPSTLMKEEKNYKSIFAEDYSVQFYLACAKIIKGVESYLKLPEIGVQPKDRTNLKFYVAMHVAAIETNMAEPTMERIAELSEIECPSLEALEGSLESVRAIFNDLGGTDQIAKGVDFLARVKTDLDCSIHG